MGTLVAKRPRTAKLAGVYARPKPTAPTARLSFFPKKASDLRRGFFDGTARQFCRERDGGKTSRANPGVARRDLDKVAVKAALNRLGAAPCQASARYSSRSFDLTAEIFAAPSMIAMTADGPCER